MTAGTGADSFPLTVATALARAMVTDESERAGLSILFIKGDALAELGLRPPGASFDVDVLAATPAVTTLTEVLGRRGWQVRPNEAASSTVFPTHSVTMFHEAWPCDLDLHESFPGCEAPPSEVLECLLTESVTVTAAGVPARTTGPVGTILLVALHLLRAPWRLPVPEWTTLVAAAPALVTFDELRELARATDSLAALTPFLRAAYPDHELGPVPPPSREWLLRTHSRHSATVRLARLGESPPWRWPGQVCRALRPSADALAAVDLEVRSMTSAQLRRARRERFGRVISELPEVLGDLRDYWSQARQARGPRHG